MQDTLPEQFLSVVNRYKFIEDVRESNLMIVYDKDKEEYISILTKPTQKVPTTTPIRLAQKETGLPI